MAVCVACETSPPVTGWICEECAATIHGLTRLLPEQIVSRVDPGGDAALIDRWGRTHALSTGTIIGRDLAPNGISIMEATVSRRHAEIVHKRDGSWWVVDLVSSNGSSVNDEPLTGPCKLTSRSVLFVGEIGFFFVAPSPGDPPVTPRMQATHRPPESATANAQSELIRLYNHEDEPVDDLDEGFTFMGLRAVDLLLASPAGGGGGVVELEGHTAQLSDVQYQLVRLLADRMHSEEGRDERVRGFVRSSELLASLPWDTPRPEDNHVKQLVRRVRRALVRGQIGDLIESRQGFGYRLRVRVRTKPPSE